MLRTARDIKSGLPADLPESDWMNIWYLMITAVSRGKACKARKNSSDSKALEAKYRYYLRKAVESDLNRCPDHFMTLPEFLLAIREEDTLEEARYVVKMHYTAKGSTILQNYPGQVHQKRTKGKSAAAYDPYELVDWLISKRHLEEEKRGFLQ